MYFFVLNIFQYLTYLKLNLNYNLQQLIRKWVYFFLIEEADPLNHEVIPSSAGRAILDVFGRLFNIICGTSQKLSKGFTDCNGDKTGKWIEYNCDRRDEGEYLHGLKEGLWFYYTEGNSSYKYAEGYYHKNFKIGSWASYYYDG